MKPGGHSSVSVGTGPGLLSGDYEVRKDGGGGGGGSLRASVPPDVNRAVIRGKTQRTPAIDENVATRNAGDAGFSNGGGAFPTGLGNVGPVDANVLGVDTNHLGHALALDLAEIQTKVG